MLAWICFALLISSIIPPIPLLNPPTNAQALEEENYALKQHSTADPATASGSSGSSGKVLANLTNTNAAAGGVGRRPTRTTAAAASSAEAGAGKGAADIREKLLALRGKKAEGAAAKAREEEV